MNRTTLAFALVVAVAVTGGAQVPVTPVPPTPPANPTPPTAATAPTPPAYPITPIPPAAVAPKAWRSDLNVWFDLDQARMAADEARMNADVIRANAQAFRDAQIEATWASRNMNVDVNLDEAVRAAVRVSDAFGSDFRLPRPVFQGEPEDSVYRLAHDLLSRGDYGRAAQMFKDIAQKYPKSVYINDLPYWEAWARYRIGTTEELRAASRLLESRVSKSAPSTTQQGSADGPRRVIAYAGRRATNDADVVTLYTRINSALASRGDRDAASRVAKLAQAGQNTCDPDEMSIRIEALSALTSMDPTAAMPKIHQILDNKDDCSERLRQRAIFILGSKRGDAEAASLIAGSAKSDPSRQVRVEAINWLPKLQGDAGVSALEDLLRNDSDEYIQRAIVRTLVSSDNPKARSSMRALIDRKDASMNLRIEAINSYGNDRATADDAAYLRSLYSKTDNDGMRSAIINTVARMGGQENEQWVLNIAKNPNEPSQARSTAISRLIRSNMAVGDIARLYDSADNYSVRSQIISVLGSRKEPEATDKLIEIAKTSTDQQLRMQAVRTLTNRKNDPRAAQLLLELLDGKSKTP